MNVTIIASPRSNSQMEAQQPPEKQNSLPRQHSTATPVAKTNQYVITSAEIAKFNDTLKQLSTFNESTISTVWKDHTLLDHLLDKYRKSEIQDIVFFFRRLDLSNQYRLLAHHKTHMSSELATVLNFFTFSKSMYTIYASIQAFG